MKNLWLVIALCVGSGSTLLGNGGAWQTGIPATGTASASNKSQKTDITLENETVKIDLHPEFADITVRYRMRNTGPKVQQDFFFPVERWGRIQTPDEDRDSDDIGNYKISVDGKELKWTNVAGPKQQIGASKEGSSEAAKLKKRPAQRREITRAKQKKAAKWSKEPTKQIPGQYGKKNCSRSNHGRNRSFPSSAIRRGT